MIILGYIDFCFCYLRIYPRPSGIEVRQPPKIDYSKIHLPKLTPNPNAYCYPPPEYCIDQRKNKNRNNCNFKSTKPEMCHSNNNLQSHSQPQKPAYKSTSMPFTTKTELKPELYDPVVNYEKEESLSNEDDYCSELDFSDNSLDDIIYNSDDDDEILDVIKHHEEKRKSTFSEKNSITSSTNNSLQNIDITSCVPEKVRRNLLVLIGEREDGIWCSKLSECYR